MPGGSSGAVPVAVDSAAAQGHDSDSSLRTLSVAPMFVEIGAGRATLALKTTISTSIGATCIARVEGGASAIHGPQRQLGDVEGRSCVKPGGLLQRRGCVTGAVTGNPFVAD